MSFYVIDTAGWSSEIPKIELEYRMVEQTEKAIGEADLCLFMVDGRVGVTGLDSIFANRLRVLGVASVLVVNKCENSKGDYDFSSEFFQLGFSRPVGISAEHGEGLNLLYDAIEPYYSGYVEKMGELVDGSNRANSDDTLQIAIVGRPNVGKSTLANKLLGDERLITGSECGITRDSIAINWKYGDRKIRLVDTAGIRKKCGNGKNLERFSVEKSLHSIDYAQVVVIVIDATESFNVQDLSITSLVLEEGRGVVFALNKWDMIKESARHSHLTKAIETIEKNFGLGECPLVPVSALNMLNLDRLMEAVFRVFDSWNCHIATGKLNRWLRTIEVENTPPLFRGQTTKLKYITQAKKRPPTFVLFTNSPERLEKTFYNRFLMNRLRKDFDLTSTAIRLLLRKYNNPYGNSSSDKK
jgi:GTP-binding protein